MKYIPINIKTHYQLLRSLIKIDELISYAKNNGITILGVTDSDMFGTMEFIDKCQKNGIKPVIGADLNIDGLSFILYAINNDGYSNLCRIVSKKNTGSLDFEFLKKYSGDILCVTNYENYDKLSQIYSTYISYSNKNEKVNALLKTQKILFLKESLYLEEKDKEYMKYLDMIREGKTIDNYEAKEYDNALLFEIDAVDYETTKNFVDKIDIKLPSYPLSLPKYSNNSENLLISLCTKGLKKRLNNNVSVKYVERLKSELKVIKDMGFIDYFLIVYDFILYAKKNKILVGPGRGSAAGSLVSYTLGITEVDPLKYDLIFERFLNKDRITLPDIDTDFEYLRRNEVLEYIKNKYGQNKVANIITFGTLLSKQVIRDVGRVLEIPLNEIDRISKFIKDKEPLKSLENNREFMNIINSKEEYRKLFLISKKLENLKRHTSTHAAGIVLSGEDLTNRIPLYKSGETIMTAYSMEYLESLGLIKMDLLAIRNLTIIDKVLKSIKKYENIDIKLEQISLEDKETIKLFHDVDTVGIFQFESEGMKGFLRNLQVQTFSDIVSAIALYRPGPRENISSYIKRKKGTEKITYLHPLLEPILKDTYGIIIYQEQIIEILKVIGGFTYSEADTIRRAMSKKKENIILDYRKKFVDGSIKQGINENISNQIYDLVLKFANYGFNKSHSVAYSMVSFQMAYLKAHFKKYFITEQLNIVIDSNIKTKEYIDEARINNIKVSNIDINKSSINYYVIDNEIIVPFNIIKNIGYEASKDIVEERQKNGEFIDIYDAIPRLVKIKINKNVINSLILSGAFDTFGYNKKTLITNIENLYNYAELTKDLDESFVIKPEIKIEQDYSKNELMKNEYELFGFYLQNHPITKYRRDGVCLLNDVQKYFDKYITIIGLVENIKEIKTKNKEMMSFLTVSDEYNKITVILFPKVYKQFKNIESGNVYKIFGKIERRMNNYQMIASRIELLK